MKAKSISVTEAKRYYDKWRNKEPEVIPQEYKIMSIDLGKLFNEAEGEAAHFCGGKKGRYIYVVDALFGLKLYSYFCDQDWFTLRVAADQGFWRYISVAVIPDTLKRRWEKANEERYYLNSVRIYLSQLWWFVFFCWSGDKVKTRKLLLSPNLTTDTIQQLVERPGRNGTDQKVYRYIMHFYASLNPKVIKKLQSKHPKGIFRAIMKLNTAYMPSVCPQCFPEAEKGYVLYLFEKLGISSEDFIPDTEADKPVSARIAG